MGAEPRRIGSTLEYRDRLDRLIQNVLRSRDLTKAELAIRLGRTRGNLCPPSGLPRLDYLVALATLLDVTVASLCAYITGDSIEVSPPSSPDRNRGWTFSELNRHLYDIMTECKYLESAPLTIQLLEIAETPIELAIAYCRRATSCVELGWMQRAIPAARCGLRAGHASASYAATLLANLAVPYLFIGDNATAESIALPVAQRLSATRSPNIVDRYALAFCAYIVGEAARRQLNPNSRTFDDQLRHSRRWLAESHAAFTSLYDELGHYVQADMLRQVSAGLIDLDQWENGSGNRDADAPLHGILRDDPDNEYQATGWTGLLAFDQLCRRGSRDEPDLELARSLLTRAWAVADQHDTWELRYQILQRVAESGPAVAPTSITTGAILGTSARFPGLARYAGRLAAVPTAPRPD